MKSVLIGLGDISPKYLEVLRELNCEINGVLTRNYEKTREKAKHFGIKKIYKNLEEMYNDNFDFFIVLVTPENNSEVLKQILHFKKPILIEKPITFSSYELEKIVRINEEFMTPVMVAMNRRFYSVFHKGLKYLKDSKNKISAISIEAPERFTDINLPKFSQLVKKNWMFSNSIHCIDLIRFFGGDITKVETNCNPNKFSYSAIGHCNKDVEFTYISNWKSPGSWSVTLYAEDVKIVYNPLEKGGIINNNERKEIIPDVEDTLFKPGFYFQLKYFVENIVNQNRFAWPASDLADHSKTMKLVEKIYGMDQKIP